MLDGKDEQEGEERRDVGDHFGPVLPYLPREEKSEPVEAIAGYAEDRDTRPKAVVLASVGYGLLTQLKNLSLRAWNQRLKQRGAERGFVQYSKVEGCIVLWFVAAVRRRKANGQQVELAFVLRVTDRADVVHEAMPYRNFRGSIMLHG